MNIVYYDKKGCYLDAVEKFYIDKRQQEGNQTTL